MESEDKINLGRASLRVPSIRYVVQITGAVGTSGADNTEQRLTQVRDVVVNWVQSKCPTQLPDGAKDGKDFEIDIPGHKFISTTLPGSDLWVVKIEHPSEDGHVWSVESEIATQGERVLFGVRSYRSAIGEQFTYPARSTPTFVRDISRQFGLFDCSKIIQEDPWVLETKSDLVTLERLLSDPCRALPVVLVSSGGDTQDEDYVIDYS